MTTHTSPNGWTEEIPSEYEGAFIPTPLEYTKPFPRDYEKPAMQEYVNNLRVEYGEFFIHPPESLYCHLNMKQQRVLSILRRGGVKTPKAILRKRRPATNDDYNKLLLACIEGLIYAWENTERRLDRVVIFLELPFNHRKLYSKDFPRPAIIGFRDWSMIGSFKCDTMIDWLYEKGKSPFDSKKLRKYLFEMLKEERRIAWAYEYYAPVSIIETFQEIMEETEVKRKDKGRGKNRYASDRRLLWKLKQEREAQEELDKK